MTVKLCTRTPISTVQTKISLNTIYRGGCEVQAEALGNGGTQGAGNRAERGHGVR